MCMLRILVLSASFFTSPLSGSVCLILCVHLYLRHAHARASSLGECNWQAVAPGDTMVAINGASVDGMKLQNVTALITSPASGAAFAVGEMTTLVFRSKRRGGEVYAINVPKPATVGGSNNAFTGEARGDGLWEEHPNRAATPAQELSRVLESSKAASPPPNLDLRRGEGLAGGQNYSGTVLYSENQPSPSRSVDSLRATWAGDRWSEMRGGSGERSEGGLRSSFADLRNSFAELPDLDWLLGSKRSEGGKEGLAPEADLHPDEVRDDMAVWL